MSTSSQTAAQQAFVQKLIDIMAQGKKPWVKPWEGGIPYMNPTTGKEYRGRNPFRLTVDAIYFGYTSPLYLGVGQAKTTYGFKLRKGFKATWIKNPIVKTEGDKKEFVGSRWIKVFNLDCFEATDLSQGITPDKIIADNQPAVIPESDRIQSVEAFLKKQPVAVKHIGNTACYIPSKDVINMPPFSAFQEAEKYYATEIHEHVHSTGHESRLSRKGITQSTNFGSTLYAEEELVAELGAAYLCDLLGIGADLEHHASYLQSWMSALEEDWKIFERSYTAAIAAANLLKQNAGFTQPLAQAQETEKEKETA